MTVIPHPRHYWGVTFKKNAKFTGTFEQCWQYLVDNFSAATVGELTKQEIRISRIK